MGLVIITGGSRGLGFECAKALKEQGHDLVLVARDEDRLSLAAAQLGCQYRAVDLEDLDAAKATFEEILISFGVPEIVILAHETGLGSRGFLVDAVCPNHSRTDMGGPDAPQSAEEGARTAVWLAMRDFDVNASRVQENLTGVLWEEMQVVPW